MKSKKLVKIISEAINETLSKGMYVINESTFFLHNDPEFPKSLARKIKSMAEKNGVNFKYEGEYVTLSVRFKDDYMWRTISKIYAVKENTDGSLNYWECAIQPNGSQHCYGPGYPDTAIHKQIPVSKNDFLLKVKSGIKFLARYNEY